MVLLLNLALFGFLIVIAYTVLKVLETKLSLKAKLKRLGILAVIVGVILKIYTAALPSYLPKGVVERSPIPEQEVVTKPIQDLQPKPMSGEERDARRKEAYKEKLPFLENK